MQETVSAKLPMKTTYLRKSLLHTIVLASLLLSVGGCGSTPSQSTEEIAAQRGQDQQAAIAAIKNNPQLTEQQKQQAIVTLQRANPPSTQPVSAKP